MSVVETEVNIIDKHLELENLSDVARCRLSRGMENVEILLGL